MKLFKSTILAMLGMAVALTSCSDDNEYEPGAKKAGAYFAQGQETTLSISPNETSFAVPVLRTSDAGTTFTVTVADPSGLFTVPTQVTFDGNATVTDLTISYDPAKLEMNKPYELTLTVGDGIDVGRNSVNLNVTMEDPMTTVPYEEGTGTYTYSGIWSGDDTELPVTVTYKPATPENVIWTISNWGYGIDLQFVCENTNETDEYGDIPFTVPCQFTGYTHSTYGRVFVADMYTYMMEVYNRPDLAAQYEGASYYTKETGTFNPYVIYYIPEYEAGTSYLGDYGYELFQLDGYPEYDVEVTYDGMFTDRNQNKTANATIVCQADVATVKAVMVAGTDPQVGINAILTDAAGVQEFEGAAEISAKFSVTEGGSFTIVAVSFDKAGEAQLYGYDTFQIVLGETDDKDWTDAGMADFADGWVLGAFSLNGVPIDVNEYMFSVPLQKYTGDFEDGVKYRLVQPWGSDFYLASNNVYPANRNLEFIVSGGDVAIYPQESGFGTTSWGGELVVGNYEGYLMENNEGIVVADAVAFLQSKGYQYISSFEDDIVTVPAPFIGAPKIGDGTFGYTWNNKQASVIVLPEAPENARAKAKAALVAAPKLSGVSARTKAVRAISKEKAQIARSINAGKLHFGTLRVR